MLSQKVGPGLWIHTIAYRGTWFENEIEFTFLYGKS